MKRLVVVGPRWLSALARRAVPAQFDVVEAGDSSEAQQLLAGASARAALMLDGWGGERWEAMIGPDAASGTKTAVVIVLSEFNSGVWIEILKQGAVDVLSEPLDMRQADAAIRSACRIADGHAPGESRCGRYGVSSWVTRSWRAVRHFVRLPLPRRLFTDLKG